jgi:hypothetical protein
MSIPKRVPFLLLIGLLACGGATVLAQSPELSAVESDPLAELAALGDMFLDEGPDVGGSIRAKKAADTDQLRRQKDKRNITAKVQEIKKGRFPTVALKLKVTKPAKEGSGKAVAKNTVLVVVPELQIKDGAVNMADSDTLQNAGSYYLTRGDKVMVRLGRQVGKVWHAEYIERR